MIFKKLNSEQAFAHGAVVTGVNMVTGYPGSPSSGTVDELIKLAKKHKIYVEWSANERVALEMAIGASIVGKRALICVKSVGMNVMLDPLMALNLTPVKAGLVILLGDDPGAYGSQNEQDTRLLAQLLELPLLEPATPAEAYQMMIEAFELSEKFETAVIIRETRSLSRQIETVHVHQTIREFESDEYRREPLRFVPVPKNVVQKHKNLHASLQRVGCWAEKSPFNKSTGIGNKGIIAAGFVFQKLLDVLEGQKSLSLKLLKLGTLFPLPVKVVTEFLKGLVDVLILEENEPFIESSIKSFAQGLSWEGKISGKLNGVVPREGELFRWQIQQVLVQFCPQFSPGKTFIPENEANEIPQRKSFCGHCRYDEVLDLLEQAAAESGQKLLITGDPGCLVTVADRIDAKYSIGSAVAVADGMGKAGVSAKPVALIGDSGFFHSTLPAICNAVHNRSRILLVVLDNASTLASGGQPHPGIGKNALGEAVPRLDIATISRACGIKFIETVNLNTPLTKIKNHFKMALLQNELAMLIVKIP